MTTRSPPPDPVPTPAEQALQRARDDLRELSAHAESVREEERKRISREIHDQLGQSLSSLRFDVQWLKRRLDEQSAFPGRTALRRRLDPMIARLDATLDQVRRLAAELRPGILDDLGLYAAVEWLADVFQQRTGIRCAVDADDTPCPEPAATQLFRILQELLTNVGRHARATSVAIHLATTPSEVVLEVADDGRGIDEEDLEAPRSLGVRGIRERVQLLNGSVRFLNPGGGGTRVVVRLPLPPSPPPATDRQGG